MADETDHDVTDGFWELVWERIGNSRPFEAKGFDTQVSKLFKFLKLGYLRNNSKNTLRDTRLAFKFSVENLILTQYSYSFKSRVD